MPEEALPYRLRPEFLSQPESAFYQVLRGMLKEHIYVCPKVGLQDIFSVMRPNENVHYFNKIYRKNIDFLLLSHDTLQPVLAIELVYKKQVDHRPTDSFMDNIFNAANLPLVHVVVQNTYDIKALAVQFSEAMKKAKGENPFDPAATFSPICPRCGITMVLRIHRSGPNEGTQYYGCLNFPECQETLPMK